MFEIYSVRHGQLAHYLGDDTIGLSLKQYGEWAESEIFLLSHCLKRGGTVLDIGANVGTHSLAFSRIVGPEGRVIAIDAQHRVFQLLCMNMLINQRINVDCLNVLMGSTTLVDKIALTEVDKVTNFGAVSFCEGGDGRNLHNRQAPIAMVTVDSLALDRCDLIKLDVEGMELDVFSGAKATITRHSPVIYFEQVADRNFKEIWQFFHEMNYALFWHAANPFNSRNYRRNRNNIFGGTIEINVVAIPNDRPDLREQLGLTENAISGPHSSPVMPEQTIDGWTLPDNAYEDLEPVKNNGVIFPCDQQSVGAASEALHELQLRFDALMEDRQKAQLIMEFQQRELDRNRG